MSGHPSESLFAIIAFFRQKYGVMSWWPGEPEEVMIGAVLTQQTRWENVVRALENLRKNGLCSLSALLLADSKDIEEAVFCTGFYRIKTQRLKALAECIISLGGISALEEYETPRLREILLGVKGIGPETADSILCYAMKRESYVIDAYTERICGCGGIEQKGDSLKGLFEETLACENAEYRQCHAWFVEYAKEMCVSGRCGECILVKR